MKTQEQILSAVLARAESDWEFRQDLLVDPRRALEKGFGLMIPEPFRIRFVERDADLDALVVLPDYRGASQSGQLNDDQLEMVNGGSCPAPWSHYR